MSPRLLFPDPRAAADALTFAQRAARLGDGIVRLRAANGTLALTSAPIAPRGLLEDVPTVIGMRFLAIDPELVCDLSVDAAALRAAGPDGVELPDSAVSATWAGISPPRTGWAGRGELAATVLATRAQWGMSAVAHALPSGAGEDAVRSIRTAVWAAPDDDLGGLPLGIAFAAFALGFIAGQEMAPVRTAGAWTRVSLVRGHVLVRTGKPRGLTPVRATGSG